MSIDLMSKKSDLNRADLVLIEVAQVRVRLDRVTTVVALAMCLVAKEVVIKAAAAEAAARVVIREEVEEASILVTDVMGLETIEFVGELEAVQNSQGQSARSHAVPVDVLNISRRTECHCSSILWHELSSSSSAAVHFL